MPVDRTAFARGVLDAYERKDILLGRGLRASAAAETAGSMSRPTGHPAFADLGLNERDHCDAAVAFIDLRRFTARTFWDEPDDVARLALAVLTQVVEVIGDHGGHILGLRGDGVFACFGGPDSQVPAVDVAAAVAACAFSLDATENALNNLLRLSGIEPVQLRAGADYGRLDFVRTGTEDANEVNVLGFAPNFASKCEKTALSWEVVVGQGLADLVGNKDLLVQHASSPKRYERAGQVKTYSFYDFRWRNLLPHLQGLRADLAGAPSSRVRVL
ncbi:Adenylate cyclase, class 3 [Geodermatophilus obscurus]|uniref:Adenylate cyclase, class 3 n=1 Tax=Geodermatophilus obscurus TaxID=1861 RepID=A0A1I5I9K3_9ACTN|nr:adenylate/guanylate cyclase domain-containing protein [Geodermatophilus obscurus]SFO57284.1 Adenylate cyclase, class 3 [Geodermatophilus obscurus]